MKSNEIDPTQKSSCITGIHRLLVNIKVIFSCELVKTVPMLLNFTKYNIQIYKKNFTTCYLFKDLDSSIKCTTLAHLILAQEISPQRKCNPHLLAYAYSLASCE